MSSGRALWFCSGGRAFAGSALGCWGRFVPAICAWADLWGWRGAIIGSAAFAVMAFVLFVGLMALFAFALVLVFVPVSEVFVATAPTTAESGAIRFVFSMLTDIPLPTLFSALFLPISTRASVRLCADRPRQQKGEGCYPETFLCHNETHILVKHLIDAQTLSRLHRNTRLTFFLTNLSGTAARPKPNIRPDTPNIISDEKRGD